MNNLIKGKCWHCGHELQTADFGREAGCLSCGKPTRVCRNCRWYAPSRPNQCEEPSVERVLDKEKANFCELFEPTLVPLSEKANRSEDSLRQAAEDLFK
ncbi:MAG: hypothetical protein JAY99_09890 [Candidatus Thiodiazotropha lotti]|uniref:hypothetical protein n=1 Tax=Candidatus Thiodiazotropha endoloripes TaxID=1818881 RepID=UPI00083E136D|nr:hypothetical protein [Candidatus Thiodiazotropha endoloripes]MCG7901681.1 hypothetical protein [Candidatus Thiodiazotropha weberae]MCG7990447.1 hypothetical protein [Candidatus Thiodiazotropha lotti]MCG7999824.1 hypothetical protein [Candidatus Thiodiazotropha lotti]MCW4182101.1 hypothetical protein [Candidatus Thiodiazotropha weberae]MCW4191593.1 hypothetical protein [Candidatus Thiodiazotropha weberae]